MTNKILSLIIVATIIGGLFGCGAPMGNDQPTAEENVQNAKEELREAKEELKDERQDETLIKDQQQFRAEYYHRIGYNEGRIAEIKLNMNKSDKDYTAKKQKIDELENKNRELKARLDQYNDSQTGEKWEQFKGEFKNDMQALGDALKGLFRDDKI
jgi:hypothetical protein